MGAALIPIVSVIAVFGSFSFVTWVIVELLRSRHRIRATTELQAKLIDRLTAQDVGPFLASDHGARLLSALAERPAAAQAHVRILRALQSGLVLLAVGISLFIYAGVRALPLEAEDGIAFFATVGTALGVGLLAAAGASYVLSRRIGLLARADAE
jgi:hypothetical protein